MRNLISSVVAVIIALHAVPAFAEDPSLAGEHARYAPQRERNREPLHGAQWALDQARAQLTARQYDEIAGQLQQLRFQEEVDAAQHGGALSTEQSEFYVDQRRQIQMRINGLKTGSAPVVAASQPDFVPSPLVAL